MELHPKPLPGRYGIEVIVVGSGPIGGTNLIGGASPLTANTTTKFYLPAPGFKCAFLGLKAHAVTVPADADGTILARAVKYDAVANGEVTLSADLNLEGLVTREVSKVGPSTSATEAQLFIRPEDSLLVSVVSNSAAIDTQPANLVFTIELARID